MSFMRTFSWKSLACTLFIWLQILTQLSWAEEQPQASSKEISVAPLVSSEGAIPANGLKEEKITPVTTPVVNIVRFEIVGNTLLNSAYIDKLLTPYKGKSKSFTDIQRALEALEGAYRSAGYSAVNVTTPEQDVTDGVVVFIVTQSVVGHIQVEGNGFYNEANIRNAIPTLKVGTTPSTRKMAQNLRLANENLTRNLEVMLALSDEEGKVDAKVKVKDQSPHKVFVTLDNTGNVNTGNYRFGVGYQNNNVFNRDQALTLNALTSPDHVKQVEQISASYRLPFYSWGDSLDLSAAYSNTDAGTTTVGGVGGPLLSFIGKGKIFSVRYNYYLPRRGEYVSKIGLSLDHRGFVNNCLINGAALCGGSGEDVTVHPVTLSYDGQLSKVSYTVDYAASLAHNIPFGANGTADTFDIVRPGIEAAYNVLRMNGSVAGLVTQSWQYRIASNFQYVQRPVLSQEAFGLVGAAAVRGFREREVFSADRGYLVNAELYAPELAGRFKLNESSLRPVLFIDHGGSFGLAASASEIATRNYATSAGAGLRMMLHKNYVAKLDVAKVLNITDNNSGLTSGNLFAHFSLVATW